jgi:hypothetical protein
MQNTVRIVAALFVLLVQISGPLKAQIVLKTNVLAPVMLGINNGGVGGVDLSAEFPTRPNRTQRIGLEWQKQSLGTRVRFDLNDTVEYNLNTARLGVSYAYKWYNKAAATGEMPTGFFWSFAANASLGYVYERWPDRGVRNFDHYLPRIGAGGGLGYTFMKNRFVIEPALRVGLISPPTAPPGYYDNQFLGNLDRLLSMLIFTRLELNLGYRI